MLTVVPSRLTPLRTASPHTDDTPFVSRCKPSALSCQNRVNRRRMIWRPCMDYRPLTRMDRGSRTTMTEWDGIARHNMVEAGFSFLIHMHMHTCNFRLSESRQALLLMTNTVVRNGLMRFELDLQNHAETISYVSLLDHPHHHHQDLSGNLVQRLQSVYRG